MAELFFALISNGKKISWLEFLQDWALVSFQSQGVIGENKT